MKSIALDGGWILTALDAPAGIAERLPEAIPATVPGVVHTDLLAAGLIADPYLDSNELLQDWIGRTRWRMSRTFEVEPAAGERVHLVFEGIDTVATVELNGAVLGHVMNMHRSHRFDVTDRLRPGENALAVTFESAIAYGEAERERLGDRPANYPGPYGFVRKMACNFGWDWGPTVVTAGLWRPVRLEVWSGARLARVRPIVTVEGDTGRVTVAVDVEGETAGWTVRASLAGMPEATGTAAVADGRAEATVTVRAPRLWWPAGLGDQPLHQLVVELLDETGAVADRWERRIGFRTVRLDTTPDAAGSAFTLVVNDVPVFVMGANWIPDDCFPSRLSPERIAARIAQARGANVNLLRVWGGGLYESEAFYEACDAAGVMVWQDFLFACACYPEEEPLRSEVEAEAREAIARLMPHPALVIWNGNNENTWGWFDWGWQPRLGDLTWGRHYYTELLPALVAEIDPTRPYVAGSPSSGTFDIHPNDEAHGCTHIWDVWNTAGWERYADYRPRFVSEFGFQAPATYATIAASVGDRPLRPDSPGLLHHQKAADGNAKLSRGLAGHLPEPADFDGWLFATQLNQARALAFGIEHFRALRPHCMGAIVWQLNDCWPVTSWAVIDGAGRLKPAWYALRRVYAPRLLTIQPHGGGLAVVGVNEDPLYWRPPLVVRRLDLAGRELARVETRLVCDRFRAMAIPLPAAVATPDDPARELIVAEAGGQRAVRFFAEDVAIDWPAADLLVETTPTEGGQTVSITAKTLVRDLCLFADRIHPDGVVDDMLVTLLPGESARLTVRHTPGFTVDAVRTAGVLQCVNNLFAAPLIH